jgi:predicted ATPase/DNA-binding XRE family transcriptional regulator/tetratricopeptide (TPR) repeat protein
LQEEISFGTWLRKQRRALDLNRQAFADQVGCAEVTLRRIEAGTLKPSKELANILLEKLDIPETDRSQWIGFARGLSGLPSKSIPSSNKPKSNLPAPLTTFIGREKEQADVIRLLGKHRLVTLTGSGGVGKSRLSIKVGEQILENYADGVWLVELAPILDPLLVPRTTAIAISLRDEPQRPIIDMLSDYLREKKMLLILDNCEHLLDSCAQLADTLLKRCPALKILATSREALGMLGEAVYHVPSLELPDMKKLLEKFRDYESVRLFEERAQLARMDFSLTIENAPSVAKICNQLDGIPLAIELAAARVGTFSTAQIEERLQESFSLLTTGNRTALPRHQTLQAAIDWSYDLLSLAEQTLFRRSSVFVNGWTLEAAESICCDVDIKSDAILNLLTHLINKSLVIRDEIQGKTRYRMLETIRQYANEKLVESGESDVLRDRHLEYFLNLAETAEPHLIRPEQLEWLPLLDADYDNLRFALEWALSQESAKPALNLCKDLWWFWEVRCYWSEGLNWVKRALAKPSQNESKDEKSTCVKVLAVHADLEWALGNFEGILAPAQASLALAREVSDGRDISIARFYVGVALRDRDIDQALSMIEQCFAEFQSLNEPFWQAYFSPYVSDLLAQAKLKNRDNFLKSLELARKAGERKILADVLSFCADSLLSALQKDEVSQRDEVMRYAEESESLYKQIGFHGPSVNSFVFAQIAWLEGNTQKARALYKAMLEHYSLLGEKASKSLCSFKLGLLEMEEGNLHDAQTYIEQALVLSRDIGFKRHIALCMTGLSNLYYLRGNLGTFKKYFREGLSLRNYFLIPHKVSILEIILGPLYFQKPECCARLLGVIDHSGREYDLWLGLISKRYCARAESYARETLGDAAFEAAFAEGQKMSLDEGLDLALKTVEEM